MVVMGFPSPSQVPPKWNQGSPPMEPEAPVCPPVAGASLMGAMSNRCKQCDQPLVEIDHWGERLAGCPKCNRWQASTGERCRLAPDNIMALRELKALRLRSEEKT
jgi:hypothetical protein